MIADWKIGVFINQFSFYYDIFFWQLITIIIIPVILPQKGK